VPNLITDRDVSISASSASSHSRYLPGWCATWLVSDLSNTDGQGSRSVQRADTAHPSRTRI